MKHWGKNPPSSKDEVMVISSLLQIKAHIGGIFGNSDDLSMMEIRIGQKKALLCFLNSMTSSAYMMEHVIRPLSFANIDAACSQPLQVVKETCFGGMASELLFSVEGLDRMLVNGYAGLAVDEVEGVLAVDVKHLDARSVEEPTSQSVIRGPKEGFTESAQTNMSLIRRRLLNVNLRFEKHTIGEQSGTHLYIAYIEGGIDRDLLWKLRTSIQKTKINSVFDSGNIENILRPKGFALFPTIYSSERPDAICEFLLERRAAVIVNGSPYVLAFPAAMRDFFKSPEDKYQWVVFGNFTRYLRYAAFLISLFISALYIAATNYQQELVPTILLISIASQREGVPFPAVIEILLMEVTFEILREAGTRMPRIVGQAISVVGALVLGQAAVEAGIVGNFAVIIVAMAAISGFAAPVYTFGSNVRLLRFALIIIASLFGIYGLILSACFLIIHLIRLTTFGFSYFDPIRLFRSKSN
ncbi:spore germination protein KA [Paenibacillus mucilaginosus]|uniref:spore germination protein n=1 Tax=Paenibacillus mucilaginosus TaxID=61624 RepID=UPI003D1BFCCA